MSTFPFTLLFQSYLKKLSSATSYNIFYMKSSTSSMEDVSLFYEKGLTGNDAYNLYRWNGSGQQLILSIAGDDSATLSGYHNNSLIPFALRHDGTNFYLDTVLSSYSSSVSANFNTFDFSLMLGGITGGVSGVNALVTTANPLIGSYANVKYFCKYQSSVSSYFINPHARFEENNMMFDYKLYDKPSGTALNSFLFALTSLSANVNLIGSTAYDLFPINLQRKYQIHGTSLPGGNFITIDDDSKRRGSSNFGYGLFSSEALNNDILDYYSSVSSFNYSALFADPDIYYHDFGHNWAPLQAHREAVINKTRYPNGINFSKFIKAIEKYKYILTGFFKTVEQFIRFRSKIIQKGINIEPTLLDREKHIITSDFDSDPQKEIKYIQAPPKTKQEDGTLISLSGLTTTNTTEEAQHNITLTSCSINSVHDTIRDISLSGYKTITTAYTDNFSQSLNDILLEPISYKGINFNQIKDFYKDNTLIQLVKKTIPTQATTIALLNKEILETSGSIVTTLTGNMTLNLFNNPDFSGTAIIKNVTLQNAYIKNYNLFATTKYDIDNHSYSGFQYAFSYYKNLTPLTGTNTLVTMSSSLGPTPLTANLVAEVLKYNFKDFGIETDKSYFRKYLKLNLQITNNNDEVLDNNNSIFEINSQVDKNYKLPIFYFYCYNNDQYYTKFPFRVASIPKDGLQFLIAINPVFTDMTLGKQNIFIKNLLSNETVIKAIDVVQLLDDQNFTGSTGSGGKGARTADAEFTDNYILSITDITNGYINFGQATNTFVDVSKGITVYINGMPQQEHVFWNYRTDGDNNQIAFNAGALTVGDAITIKYKY